MAPQSPEANISNANRNQSAGKHGDHLGVYRQIAYGSKESADRKPDSEKHADAEKQIPIRQNQTLPPEGKTTTISIADKTGPDRSYDVYVPKNFNAKLPTKVILVAHGALPGNVDGAKIMQTETDFNNLAEGSDHPQCNVVIAYVRSKERQNVPVGLEVGIASGLGVRIPDISVPIADWNGPGKNLMSTDKSYDDLKYVDSVIADVKQKLGNGNLTVEGFGFSDGGRLLNEYNYSRPGVLKAFVSDHGTSLGNENAAAGKGTRVMVIESGATQHHQFRLDTGDRMLPPEGGEGDLGKKTGLGSLFPGAFDSQPMMQVREAVQADQCKAATTHQEGHNQITEYLDCATGQVVVVREYKADGSPAEHAVNDTKIGQGGMMIMGERSDNNAVGLSWEFLIAGDLHSMQQSVSR